MRITMAILISAVFAAQADAGTWFIEGSVGAAFHRSTTDDGTWRQEGVQSPNVRLFDQAWAIGMQYRIDERLSVQGHRFDWGSASVKSRFVSDSDYDPVRHVCLANCAGTYSRVLDRMTGYDFTVSRYWPLARGVEGYLKGGGAVAFHELKWSGPDGSTFGPTRTHGAIPMVVVGGGFCYELFCVDTSLYQGTLSMNGGCLNGGQYDCGYPLSKQVIVTTVGFKIPLPDLRR